MPEVSSYKKIDTEARETKSEMKKSDGGLMTIGTNFSFNGREKRKGRETFGRESENSPIGPEKPGVGFTDLPLHNLIALNRKLSKTDTQEL